MKIRSRVIKSEIMTAAAIDPADMPGELSSPTCAFCAEAPELNTGSDGDGRRERGGGALDVGDAGGERVMVDGGGGDNDTTMPGGGGDSNAGSSGGGGRTGRPFRVLHSGHLAHLQRGQLSAKLFAHQGKQAS